MINLAFKRNWWAAILVGLVLVIVIIAVSIVPRESKAVLRCQDDATCEEQRRLETELQERGERLLSELKRDIDETLLDPDQMTSVIKSQVLDSFETYKQELRALYDDYKRRFIELEMGVRVASQVDFAALLDSEYDDKVKWADFAIKLSLEADAEEKKTYRIVKKFTEINEKMRDMSDLVSDIREELDRLNSKLPCTSQTCI